MQPFIKLFPLIIGGIVTAMLYNKKDLPKITTEKSNEEKIEVKKKIKSVKIKTEKPKKEKKNDTEEKESSSNEPEPKTN